MWGTLVLLFHVIAWVCIRHASADEPSFQPLQALKRYCSSDTLQIFTVLG